MKIFGKRKIVYVIYAVIALVFMIVQAVFSIFGNEEQKSQRDTNTENIERNINFQKRYDGIVISKFNDNNNHNRETIEILLSDGSEFYLLPYFNDKTGFYDFVQEGDSIFKDDWGFTFRVRRDKLDVKFIIHPDYVDEK